jgi:hypothetical protein
MTEKLIDTHPPLAAALAKYSHLKWSKLPRADRRRVAECLGKNLELKKDKEYLSDTWSRLKKNKAMVQDAKDIVTEAEAKAANNAPAPASNVATLTFPTQDAVPGVSGRGPYPVNLSSATLNRGSLMINPPTPGGDLLVGSALDGSAAAAATSAGAEGQAGAPLWHPHPCSHGYPLVPGHPHPYPNGYPPVPGQPNAAYNPTNSELVPTPTAADRATIAFMQNMEKTHKEDQAQNHAFLQDMRKGLKEDQAKNHAILKGVGTCGGNFGEAQ